MAAPPAYLDEDVPVQAGDGLRHRGFTVLTTAEASAFTAPDEAQLIRATALSYVLVSHNRWHFRRLHEEFVRTNRSHSGIVLVPQDTDIESYSAARTHPRLDRRAGMARITSLAVECLPASADPWVPPDRLFQARYPACPWPRRTTLSNQACAPASDRGVAAIQRPAGRALSARSTLPSPASPQSPPPLPPGTSSPAQTAPCSPAHAAQQ
jgi:hypothetical protein